MINEKPRIEFYRQRTFSEKMNATLEFIRENWKPLLKYTFYIIMPVCLIQTFAINAFFDTYMGLLSRSAGGDIFNNSMYSVFANYGIWILCMMIGGAIMSGLIYAMMQTYATRENRLQGVTLDDFKEYLIKNTWKYIRVIFLLLIAYLLIVFFIILLAFISTMTLILTIPLFIAFVLLIIPLMIVIPVYIFERDIKLMDAIKKAWKLGTATLWGMLGLMIVLNIISSVIQTVTMMPWYLTTLVGRNGIFNSIRINNESITYLQGHYLHTRIDTIIRHVCVNDNRYYRTGFPVFSRPRKS